MTKQLKHNELTTTDKQAINHFYTLVCEYDKNSNQEGTEKETFHFSGVSARDIKNAQCALLDDLDTNLKHDLISTLEREILLLVQAKTEHISRELYDEQSYFFKHLKHREIYKSLALYTALNFENLEDYSLRLVDDPKKRNADADLSKYRDALVFAKTCIDKITELNIIDKQKESVEATTHVGENGELMGSRGIFLNRLYRFCYQYKHNQNATKTVSMVLSGWELESALEKVSTTKDSDAQLRIEISTEDTVKIWGRLRLNLPLGDDPYFDGIIDLVKDALNGCVNSQIKVREDIALHMVLCPTFLFNPCGTVYFSDFNFDKNKDGDDTGDSTTPDAFLIEQAFDVMHAKTAEYHRQNWEV